MLHIRYAARDRLIKEYDMVQYHDTHFQALFEESWLQEDWAQRAVREIDHIPVEKSIHQALFDRGITYYQLSGGIKTLLLVRHMSGLFEFEHMGYNCYTYLMEIADMQEVYMGMDYPHAEFDDEVIKSRQIEIINTGTIVTNATSLWKEVFKLDGARYS